MSYEIIDEFEIHKNNPRFKWFSNQDRTLFGKHETMDNPFAPSVIRESNGKEVVYISAKEAESLVEKLKKDREDSIKAGDKLIEKSKDK